MSLRLEELSPDVVAIVTDIEGTTTDIAFAQDVLFPYARARMPAWLREHADQPEVAAAVDTVRAELNEPDADLTHVIETLERWMDSNRKSAALGTLQGMLWRHGYETQDFSGHVYEDAVAALQAWADDRRALFVYSSGSVAAQKLLFTHSDHGDLSDLFSGYFDTRMGPKKKTASYQRIAAELGEMPGALLFLSDVGDELDAAKAAGWQTCWVARDDQTFDKATLNEGHAIVRSFDDIELV